MGGGGGGIPAKWLGCPKLAVGLIDGLFLVFKTPLNVNLNKNLPLQEKFVLGDVFEEIERLGRKDGKVLWINLTNTDRYYQWSPEAVAGDNWRSPEPRLDVVFRKMPIIGHGAVPSPSERERFNKTIDGFLEGSPQGLVAVHCTHGFNRTGFLISWYLMTKRGFNPFEAVEEFRRCRPPGMYRQNYVDQLFQLWNGDAESKASLPAVPQVEIPPWTISNNNNANANRVKSGVHAETSSSSSTRFDGLRSNSQSEQPQQQQHQLGPHRSSRNRPSRWEPYAQPLPQARINYHYDAPSQFYTEDYTADNFNFNSPYAGDPGQWSNRHYNNNPYQGPVRNNMGYANGGVPTRRNDQPQYQHQHPPMRHRYDGHHHHHTNEQYTPYEHYDQDQGPEVQHTESTQEPCQNANKYKWSKSKV